MAHNPTMNNQPHPSMMTSIAGSSSQQRGLSSKSMYQLQSSDMAPLSHMQPQQQQSHQQQHHHQQQQQSQMISGYSNQKTSDITSHQFPSDVMNMNGGGYQSLGGSSLHSNLSMDNNQISMHQHNQPSSHLYNQPSQHQTSSPQQQQHYHSNPINHHHHTQHQQQQSQKPVTQQLVQSSHQYNMQPVGKTQQQASQQQQASHHSQLKPIHQQSRQQPYIHTQHRNSQQPKYERAQQPRRILQNTNSMNHRVVAKEHSHNLFPTVQMKDTTEPADAILSNSDTSGIYSEEDSSACNKENKEGEKTGELEITDDSGSASENKELANTKEKTPMTLVQELAKFNKIERKYTLLDEQGPAHKKTFYVKLQLGTEEYSSSGPSIRKAQQSAAAIALKDTQFKDPPQKPAWKTRRDPEDDKLTPTVELNGLAMKRGEAATYKAIEPQQPPYYYPPGMDPRMYSQRYLHHMRASRDPRFAARGYWPMRYHYPRMNRGFYVSLRVGHREFIGDGPTRQAARHNAAIKALKVLRNLPEKDVNEEEEKEEAPELEETVDDVDGLKSRVTSVHEIAFRRKLTVNFEVIRESGPPHMKTFITRCTVGDLVTEGEGNSKKLSKKIASEDMFEKLKALGPLPPCAVKPKQKMQVFKKKNRIKADIQQQKADPNYGVGVNPISRLIQIMCAQKKKEPVYTLMAERGVSCRKEFIMQIEVEGKTCNGSGPNKKLAKRAAAEAMLDLLGYNKPSPQPAKSSIKQPSSEGHASGNGEKKVHFNEICQKSDSTETKISGPCLQQKVPGLLHLPSKTVVSTPVSSSSCNSSQPSTSSQSNPKESLVNLSSILKPNWRPELQLRELCKALKYPIEINDFTKSQSNSNMEYMSRISIGGSGDNQQSFLGSSNSSVESARDVACMDALKVLMSRIKDMHPAGDGRSSHVKKTVLSRTGSGLRDVSH